MKNYAFLFLPLLFCSCEQLNMTDIQNLDNNQFQIKSDQSPSQTKSASKGKKPFKLVTCDVDRCEIEYDNDNHVLECLNCTDPREVPETVIIQSYLRGPGRICHGKLFSGCEPPMPLEDFVIEVHFEEKMVSGKITDERGNVFAQTSPRSISYDEETKKAYLRFQEVNPELRERSLLLEVNTSVFFRRGVSKITLQGELGRESFE